VLCVSFLQRQKTVSVESFLAYGSFFSLSLNTLSCYFVFPRFVAYLLLHLFPSCYVVCFWVHIRIKTSHKSQDPILELGLT
jgi:hypothetical protein